jgi:hypothetical protein
MQVGTVIATGQDPNTAGFTFLAGPGVVVGKFVWLKVPQGRAFAVVTGIVRTNRYFMSPEIVRGFELGGSLAEALPAEQWECWLAQARFIGVEAGNGLDRVLAPPSPGEKVFAVEPERMAELLGCSEKGIELGVLRDHSIPLRLDMTRLFQRHLAILAMTGAGKSNCARVLVEELLSRPREWGRPAVVLVDVHGEYGGLGDHYPDRVRVIDACQARIGLRGVTAERLREFLPEMSGAQVRELKRALLKLKQRGRPFDLADVASEIESDEGPSRTSRQALLGWVQELEALGVFGKHDFPVWSEALAPGTALVFDLSRVVSLRKKQVLVAHMLWELFHARERRLVPPLVVFLEEAHLFAPSESAVSKRVIERIAREGRKFHFSLVVISQRPVRLSATLLSQIGTNIILRVTNPYDLDHLKRSAEALTAQMAEALTALPVGEALVLGEAVNHPVFVRIRRGRCAGGEAPGFERAALEFERSLELARELAAQRGGKDLGLERVSAAACRAAAR